MSHQKRIAAVTVHLIVNGFPTICIKFAQTLFLIFLQFLVSFKATQTFQNRKYCATMSEFI